MPEWISPATVNTFFLACFFCVVIWGGAKLARFFAPLVRDQFERRSKAHDAQAKLADSLTTTTTQQTSLMERQTAMLSNHGDQLAEVKTDVKHLKDEFGQHTTKLEEIRLKIVGGCE